MGAENGFKSSHKRTIPQRWALKMVSTSFQNDAKDVPFPSDGRSKWFQIIAETNHSPAMGAPLPTLLPAPPPHVSLPLLPSSRSSSFSTGVVALLLLLTWKIRRTLSAQTPCLWAKLHTSPRRAHTLTLFLSLSLSTAACECTPGPRVHAIMLAGLNRRAALELAAKTKSRRAALDQPAPLPPAWQSFNSV